MTRLGLLAARLVVALLVAAQAGRAQNGQMTVRIYRVSDPVKFAATGLPLPPNSLIFLNGLLAEAGGDYIVVGTGTASTFRMIGPLSLSDHITVVTFAVQTGGNTSNTARAKKASQK